MIGISRQAFHEHYKNHKRRLEEEAQLLPLIYEIREAHPRMGVRKIYEMLKPETTGRDRFEAFCFENGFKLGPDRAYHITTRRAKGLLCEDHVKGKELTGINQVWVSDITYYALPYSFAYVTFVMDLYSRYIRGYAVSERLFTEVTSLAALKMALSNIKGQNIKGLIFHSDGGGQYYSDLFRSFTESKGIVSSLAQEVYDNANAERLNGIIKNEYLKPWQPDDMYKLMKATQRAVNLYNENRPHMSLSYKSPLAFERELVTRGKVISSPVTPAL